jgi:hypothetical protein
MFTKEKQGFFGKNNPAASARAFLSSIPAWLSAKRPGTRITWDTATACLHSWRMGAMPSPSEIDSDFLHSWAAWMRRKGYAEATIKSYLGILRAGVNWAAEVGIVATVPRFPRIEAGGKMGGRPITGEEFDRMLAAVKKERSGASSVWKESRSRFTAMGRRCGHSRSLTIFCRRCGPRRRCRKRRARRSTWAS